MFLSLLSCLLLFFIIVQILNQTLRNCILIIISFSFNFLWNISHKVEIPKLMKHRVACKVNWSLIIIIHHLNRGSSFNKHFYHIKIANHHSLMKSGVSMLVLLMDVHTEIKEKLSCLKIIVHDRMIQRAISNLVVDCKVSFFKSIHILSNIHNIVSSTSSE